MRAIQNVEKEFCLTEQQTSEINAYLDSLGSNLDTFHKMQFIGICRMYKLNPLKKEIYGIAVWDKKRRVNTLTTIVAYKVPLARGEATGLLRGWHAWTEKEGNELVARIEIHRKDWDQPFRHEVYFSEYAQYTYRDGNRVLNKFWASKPRTMLKKVAIAQGFRLCFTEECGNLPYIREEIEDEPNVETRMQDSPFRDADAEIVESESVDDQDSAPNYHDGDNTGPIQKKIDSKAPEGHGAHQASNDTAGPQTKSNREPEPSSAENYTVPEMREYILDRFKDNAGDADRFFIAKSWIPEGDGLSSLSDNQVRRLYKNFDAIWKLFSAWIKSKK